MLSTELTRALETALEAEIPAATELRHRLHADPEPSGSEWRTATTVAEAIGVGTAVTVAGTGRLIRVGPGEGPCVAVRGELDALTVTEHTGAADASTNGFMHACGHDVHLAAVSALTRAADTAGLPLLAILQPREEGPPSGARDIVDAKVLAEYDVAGIVGAHVQPLLGRRTVAATAGAVNAAADHFEIIVTGRGGHGGYPHLTHDPVVAIAQVVVGLQHLISRRIDPLHSAVVTVGSLHAGTAPNVIPDEARAEGTLRALDPADREPLQREIATIADRIASAFGCHAEVRIHEGEPALVNDPALAERTHHWLAHLGYDVSPPLRSCGADDFAYYGAVAPSLMMFVGLDHDEDLPPVMLHHPTFHPPDETVGDVARALLAGCLAALDRQAADRGTVAP